MWNPLHSILHIEDISKQTDGRVIPKNAFGWLTLCGFLHLRPIPLHSRDERVGPFSPPSMV
jgi:hypothetical protein